MTADHRSTEFATETDILALQRMLAAADAIVAFTGAGISTECGVPDFRSPGSPWLKNQPIEFGEFLASPTARMEAWRRKFAMDDIYSGAQPGRGHQALARLVAQGRMPGVITQNIDGLHQASGVPSGQIVELHGNGTYATCLDCGLRHELVEVRRRFEGSNQPPSCVSCDGVVKSATISFGQAMPERAMLKAQALTLACDLFLVIGSSLVVQPAASFPVLARRNGAKLVIINRDETPLDTMADLVVNDDIGDVLTRASLPG
ncbi:NAD-dependent protein deacetylase 1 [Chelatococcus reniformis]|uniref:protein acetyllysine N-acetyltransferase n=2 Tax=Chelatococcus reniformis TaxID=1494448 RepID=A0A916U135_9HYPH|nr:NAD-dependent protein deacetylase 1 [Chelatococcus reniformis]